MSTQLFFRCPKHQYKRERDLPHGKGPNKETFFGVPNTSTNGRERLTTPQRPKQRNIKADLKNSGLTKHTSHLLRRGPNTKGKTKNKIK